MSFEITDWFVQQYSRAVHTNVQQKGSRLRRTVMIEPVVGKNAFVDTISKTAAQKRTSRHSDSPLISTPHDRRRLSLSDFEWGDLIDRPDMVRTLNDPTNDYSRAAGWAMGRSMDDEVITAALAIAASGETGSGTAPFLASQTVAVDFDDTGGSGNTNLTLDKLRRANFLFQSNDVDDDEERFIIVSASQIASLLVDSTLTSSDFNTVKALVNGDINAFMGFTFVRTQRLTFSSGVIRSCLAWTKPAIRLGIGMDITARIAERADKSFSTYVFYAMSIGAVRMEEELVVEILCDEA